LHGICASSFSFPWVGVFWKQFSQSPQQRNSVVSAMIFTESLGRTPGIRVSPRTSISTQGMISRIICTLPKIRRRVLIISRFSESISCTAFETTRFRSCISTRFPHLHRRTVTIEAFSGASPWEPWTDPAEVGTTVRSTSFILRTALCAESWSLFPSCGRVEL
jgi:hypothetical protein